MLPTESSICVVPGCVICQRCGASLMQEQAAYEYREFADRLVLRCTDHQMCERWRAYAARAVEMAAVAGFSPTQAACAAGAG